MGGQELQNKAHTSLILAHRYNDVYYTLYKAHEEWPKLTDLLTRPFGLVWPSSTVSSTLIASYSDSVHCSAQNVSTYWSRSEPASHF